MSEKFKMKFIGIILFCTIIFVSCSEKVSRPPIVMFQNTLYIVASNATETASFYEEELTNWGTINSSTENEDLPTQNFQTSDTSVIGCQIYTSKEFPNHIFVMYKDSEGLRHYNPYIKYDE